MRLLRILFPWKRKPGYLVLSTLYDMLARTDKLGIPLSSALESMEETREPEH